MVQKKEPPSFCIRMPLGRIILHTSRNTELALRGLTDTLPERTPWNSKSEDRAFEFCSTSYLLFDIRQSLCFLTLGFLTSKMGILIKVSLSLC